MFEEVRLAAILAKNHTNDPTSLPASTALTMATRLGAQAMHIGHLTGSLEAGKRADLILLDISRIHNSPRFKRDSQNIYAQIVYASKSTDVTDVMVNGKWLMRENKLLTLNEADLLKAADAYARKIDTFLTAREQSVLSKLIALGGSAEEESFEVQVKVKVADQTSVLKGLNNPEIKIIRKRHYRQHDTYFFFEDDAQGRLRYREDDFIDDSNLVTNVRGRLTLLGVKREGTFGHDILLSRSRFLAPATHSQRFYREYFRPEKELTIEKDRLRWLVIFKEEEFFINLDRLIQPELGFFLEIKSRTWSRKDAEEKAALVEELITLLGASTHDVVTDDYTEIVDKK
jgi:5-methylthioadenosine/S-adenosylhomocysteine deaminase